MKSSTFRIISLILKLFLMLIILVVSFTDTMFSVQYMMIDRWWFSYARESESLEHAFIALGFLAFVLCIISSILSCCGLRKKNRNMKFIPITDVVLCVVTALLLLVAGLLLIIAAQYLCNYDRVLEFERNNKNLNQLIYILGRLDGNETDWYTVGNKPKDGGDTTEEYDFTPEQARKFFNDNCPRYCNVTPRIIAGSVAMVVGLLFLLPIGLDVKQIREKPTAEEEMEEVKEEAFAAPTGEPAVVYPNYYATPPPEYQPQNISYVYYVPPTQPENGGVAFGPPVSQNYIKSSGGGPQMSPSQNPQ